MDSKILYTAKFTHHDLKFHKVWWKSDKRCGSWSGQTDRPIPIYPSNYVCRGYDYLRKIKSFREAGYDIVYMDETWVNQNHCTDYMWLPNDGSDAPKNTLG
jgi:hypothetical protein